MEDIDPQIAGVEFVEVRDEPLHRPRFRNDYVYVYDVFITPGQQSLYHRHAEDTFYVGITGGRATNQPLGKEPVVNEGPPGFSACLCHHGNPLIHRVGNVGTKDIRLIGAEARNRPAQVSAEPLVHPGHELIWETERVRGYRLTLEPGEVLPEADYRFSGLLVLLSFGCLASIDHGSAETVGWKSPGDWLWNDGPVRRTWRNRGSTRIEAVLGEWK